MLGSKDHGHFATASTGSSEGTVVRTVVKCSDVRAETKSQKGVPPELWRSPSPPILYFPPKKSQVVVRRRFGHGVCQFPVNCVDRRVLTRLPNALEQDLVLISA